MSKPTNDYFRTLEYLGESLRDETKHILSDVIDIKNYPLTPLSLLTADKDHQVAFKDFTDSLTAEFEKEYHTALGSSKHLEELCLWWWFLKRQTQVFFEQKSEIASSLGLKAAAAMFQSAYETLPDFISPEDMKRFEKTHATQDLLAAWRIGQPSVFPSPKEFNSRLRTALRIDTEATELVNASDGKVRKSRNKNPKKHGWRSQKEAALDFGVSLSTIKNWDRISPDYATSHLNPYGYYELLRRDKSLIDAYWDLANMVKSYKKSTERHHIRFTEYKSDYLLHNK